MKSADRLTSSKSSVFNVSRMTAEVGIGLKDVRILGFSLGDLGKTWTFDLVDPVTANIIPETKFCEIELK